jgi:hypothetical protein
MMPVLKAHEKDTTPVPLPVEATRRLDEIDIYRPVTWHADGAGRFPAGEIYPIRDTSDLVVRFEAGVALLAGLRSGSDGHVVAISGLSYLATPEGNRLRIDPATHLQWVEVMDPESEGETHYKISGDDFMRSARFILGIALDR